MIRVSGPRGRLPLHPRPLPHEALSSWVARLAAAYKLEPDGFVRSAFGADPPPDDGELDAGGGPPGLVSALAERTGVPSKRVRAMTLAGYAPELTGAAEPSPGLLDAYIGRFGWFVPPPARVATRPVPSECWVPWRAEDLLGILPRCCPRCLATDTVPYVRLHWRLAWIASCPIHGETLTPLTVTPLVDAPWLVRFLREREPKYAAPHLLALDRITLGAVTTGRAMLPRGGGSVPGDAWLRALRSLLDEVAQPEAVLANCGHNEVAAAWLRSGRLFVTWRSYSSVPFEHLPPEDRAVLLRVAGAVIRHLAVRPARDSSGSALRARVTQWQAGKVCGAQTA